MRFAFSHGLDMLTAMNYLFPRIIVILSIFIVPIFTYAGSGKVSIDAIIQLSSGSIHTTDIQASSGVSLEKKEDKGESISNSGTTDEEDIKNEEEEKIKQDINTYIIESYKAQGTKIIKDLSTKLAKTIPDDTDRKEAYMKIRSSLSLRKKRIESVKMSDTKKMILDEFLEHMIGLLDKKIDEIK